MLPTCPSGHVPSAVLHHASADFYPLPRLPHYPAADKTWMLGAIPVIVFLFLTCCSLLCYRCCLVCGMGRRSRAALAAQAEGEAAVSGSDESDDRFQTWDSLMTAAEVAEQVGAGSVLLVCVSAALVHCTAHTVCISATLPMQVGRCWCYDGSLVASLVQRPHHRLAMLRW
jgi:hypothetical protein